MKKKTINAMSYIFTLIGATFYALTLFHPSNWRSILSVMLLIIAGMLLIIAGYFKGIADATEGEEVRDK